LLFEQLLKINKAIRGKKAFMVNVFLYFFNSRCKGIKMSLT